MLFSCYLQIFHSFIGHLRCFVANLLVLIFLGLFCICAILIAFSISGQGGRHVQSKVYKTWNVLKLSVLGRSCLMRSVAVSPKALRVYFALFLNLIVSCLFWFFVGYCDIWFVFSFAAFFLSPRSRLLTPGFCRQGPRLTLRSQKQVGWGTWLGFCWSEVFALIMIGSETKWVWRDSARRVAAHSLIMLLYTYKVLVKHWLSQWQEWSTSQNTEWQS